MLLVATTLSSLEIEVNNWEDYTGVVIKARECHVLIENLRHTSIQRFESASSTSHLVNIISVMLAIVFSAVASGIISDKILRRINHVTGRASDHDLC